MNKSTILVNIDESAISDSTKANYSWGQKGVPQNLSTLAIQGSINLITAIASNGMSITENSKRNGESRDFYRIYETFANYLKSIIGIAEEQIWIILDNCSVHW